MVTRNRNIAIVLAGLMICGPAAADLVPMIEPVVPGDDSDVLPFVPVSEELAESLKSDGFLDPILTPLQEPVPVWCALARARALDDGTTEYVAGPERLFDAAATAPGPRAPVAGIAPSGARFAVRPSVGAQGDLHRVQDEAFVIDPALDAALAEDPGMCVECAMADFDAGEVPMEKWQILDDEFEVLPDEEGLPLAGAPWLVSPDGGGIGGIPLILPGLGGGGGGGGFGFLPLFALFGGGGGGGGGGTPGIPGTPGTPGSPGTHGTPGGGGPVVTPPPPPSPVPLPAPILLSVASLAGLRVVRRSRRGA